MFRTGRGTGNELEFEANEFAATLLIPENLVRKYWSSWSSVEMLADIFKVSLSAMSYRLYKLGLKGDWQMGNENRIEKFDESQINSQSQIGDVNLDRWC